MQKNTLCCLVAILTSVFMIACDRHASSSNSRVAFQLPSQVAQKSGEASTLNNLTLHHVSVQVTAPDIVTPIQLIADVEYGNMPDKIELEIPSGAGRLVQVLAAYGTPGTDHSSLIYYGDMTANLKNPNEAIDVPMTTLGSGTEGEAKIAGRYLDTANSGPTGHISLIYRPMGKPGLIIEKKPIIGGWFKIMAFQDIPLDYVLPDGTFLGQQWTASSIQTSAQIAKLNVAAGYRSDWGMGMGMGTITWSALEARTEILGFFAKDATLIADKKICVKNPVTFNNGTSHMYSNSYMQNEFATRAVKYFPVGTTPILANEYVSVAGGLALASCGNLNGNDEHSSFLHVDFELLGSSYQIGLFEAAGVNEGLASKKSTAANPVSSYRLENRRGFDSVSGSYYDYFLLPGFSSFVQKAHIYLPPPAGSTYYNPSCNDQELEAAGFTRYKTIDPEIVNGNLRIRSANIGLASGTPTGAPLICLVGNGKMFGRPAYLQVPNGQTADTLSMQLTNPMFDLLPHVGECQPFRMGVHGSSFAGYNNFSDLEVQVSATGTILHKTSDCSDVASSNMTMQIPPFEDGIYGYIKSNTAESYTITHTNNNKGLAPATGFTYTVTNEASPATKLEIGSATHYPYAQSPGTNLNMHSCLPVFIRAKGSGDTSKITGQVNLSFKKADRVSPYTEPGLTIVDSCVSRNPISSVNFIAQSVKVVGVLATGTIPATDAVLKVDFPSLPVAYFNINIQPQALKLSWVPSSNLTVTAGSCQMLVLEAQDFANQPVILNKDVLTNFISEISGSAIYPDASCSASAITSKILPAGSSQAIVYYRSTVNGIGFLRAQTPQTSYQEQSIYIYVIPPPLSVINTPNSISIGSTTPYAISGGLETINVSGTTGSVTALITGSPGSRILSVTAGGTAGAASVTITDGGGQNFILNLSVF